MKDLVKSFGVSARTAAQARMKSCEIISDNLSKAGLELGAVYQRLIPTGKQSGSLTRIETTEKGMSFVVTRNWRRFLNLSESRTKSQSQRWLAICDCHDTLPWLISFSLGAEPTRCLTASAVLRY